MEKDLSIHCLPDEVICLVLQYNDINEIINFCSTCKRFNELMNSNQSLWKDKFKITLPFVFEVVEKRSTGLWLNELKDFMKLKQLIYRELITMSPKYYWKIDEITVEDVNYFFTIATSTSLGYYYTIYILQDIVKKGNKIINQLYSKKPFTLTELHYAKTVLRYLIHCYLAVKWVKAKISHELPPEVVINYFLQWIDTVNFHFDEDVEDKLQDLATMVNIYLEKTYKTQTNSNTRYSARQIFAAVSQVLFHQRHMALTASANLDTLDIIKVWDNKYGNQIVIFAIFQAVAKRCGAVCELIVFSNHLFLEWRSDENHPNAQVFTINISNGELEPKRRCPFAQSNQNARYRYSADSLLQCLHSSFVKTMGAIKSWATQNASYLSGFLSGNYSIPCPYDNFYEYLYRHIDLNLLNKDLNIKYLTETELETILSLVQLNSKNGNKHVNILEVKKHHSSVLYAVGMLCCHKEHGYVCIVRGWDLTCGPEWRPGIPTDDLHLGYNQPFYHVLAADQSNRYVAQENLIALTQPTRLYHLEELIAKEFCHFDGFSYVLNDEKKMEYPDEAPIVEVFRQRSFQQVV